MSFNTPSVPKPPPVNKIDSWSTLTDYLRQLAVYLTKEFQRRPAPGTAVGSVLLASPNGSVYTVQVTDLGALTVTQVS